MALVSGGPLAPEVTGREFPELCRLVVRTCASWAAEMEEVSRRLEQDGPLVAERFGTGGRERLISVAPGLSDPHHDGRSVHVLRFERYSVVYKPRSVEVERRFQRIVQWFGDLLGVEMRGVELEEREGYAWCEYIDFQPLGAAADAQAFFERAGVLLFVCFLLGVTDCHRENVGTTRAGPVLLDAETVFHPDFVPALIPWEQPADTVLRPGLVHAVRPLALDFGSAEVVIQSFTRAYQAVLHDPGLRRALCERMDGFAGNLSRVVFRATRFYHDVMARSLSPTLLRSTEGRLRMLQEEVARAFAGAWSVAPLLAGEWTSMQALDVPHFTARTVGTDVTDGGSHVAPSLLTCSGLDAARARLDSLDRVQLKRTQALLRAALRG